MIEIWQPKYKTNSVLIATYKVANGTNLIKFTKAKHLQGLVFEASGSDIRSCPIQTNGRVDCFDVPMSMLKQH